MIRSRSVGKILDISENALAMAGYTVLDGDHESVVIRDKAGYNDYKITVEENLLKDNQYMTTKNE